MTPAEVLALLQVVARQQMQIAQLEAALTQIEQAQQPPPPTV